MRILIITMMKIIQLTSFVVLFGAFFVIAPVYAYDATIVCDSGDCSYSPAGEPLWDEKDVPAGETVRKVLSIRNEDSNDCEFAIDVADDGGSDVSFLENMFVVVTRSDGEVYGEKDGDSASNDKNFSEMINDGYISLGTIGGGEELEYAWWLTLNRDADNSLQGVESAFDFHLNFTCLGEDVLLPEILGTKLFVGGTTLPVLSEGVVLGDGVVMSDSSGTDILGVVSEGGVVGTVLGESATCFETCGYTSRDFAKLLLLLLIILFIVRYIYLTVKEKRKQELEY